MHKEIRHLLRYVPESVYPNESYPMYIQGNCYLMTSDVPKRLLQHLQTAITKFHIEDVLYNGVLAEKANVSRKHIEGSKAIENFCEISHPSWCVSPTVIIIIIIEMETRKLHQKWREKQ